MRFVEYDEDVASAEEWALLGLPESETPVQVTQYLSERFGEIVQAAITFRGVNPAPGRAVACGSR